MTFKTFREIVIILIIVGVLMYGAARFVFEALPPIVISMEPSATLAPGLGDQLVFPNGWEPVACASPGTIACHWICRSYSAPTIYRQCMPVIQPPATAEVQR